MPPKFGTTEKCEVCTKTVYPDDKIIVDSKLMHGSCFRCKKCNTKLTLGNYAALEGVPFCKPHFKEAFRLKGKYDFGGEKSESSPGDEEPTKVEAPKQEAPKQEAPKPKPVETPAPTTSGPPPPGPPPPPPVVENNEAPKGGGADDLFASINQLRDNAGSGLRKVKAEEKTKNRKEEDKVSVVPDEIVPKKQVAVKGGKKQGPPKFELQSGIGEKWIVENQNDQQLEITETKTKQAVYMYNCKNTWITVKGKVNNVILDSCTKSGVVLDDAIASVEMVNCSGVKVQILGIVPIVNVDKTDGVQIFLSKDSATASIITSKSSEMNVLVPGETEDDDMIEIPIPEQFQHIWDPEKKKLITECLSLNL